MKVSSLHIYPIKSLGGFEIQEAILTKRGLKYDRRFMLTTPEGQFLTQRKIAAMALLKTRIENDQLVVWDSRQASDLLIFPLEPSIFLKEQSVSIWKDTCTASVMPTKVNQWFSKKLQQDCQLVYMSDHNERAIEEEHRKEGEIVSFADAYPILVLGEQALAVISKQAAAPIPANRFRANILFQGAAAFEEDNWKYFTIGTNTFRGVKPCARCNVPNINQETAQIEIEPNRSLATYRKIKNKVYVGQNVCWEQQGEKEGKIKVEDVIKLK